MNFYPELFLYFSFVLKKKYFEHVWIRIKVWTTSIEMQHNVLHNPYIVFYFCPLRDFGGMLPNPRGVLMRVDIKRQLGEYFRDMKRDSENMKLCFSQYDVEERLFIWRFDWVSNGKYFWKLYASILTSSFCVLKIRLIVNICSGYMEFSLCILMLSCITSERDSQANCFWQVRTLKHCGRTIFVIV